MSHDRELSEEADLEISREEIAQSRLELFLKTQPIITLQLLLIAQEKQK